MPERWIILPEGASPQTQVGLSQILAVHAALLPNGKVLYFGGSQHVYEDIPSTNDPRLDNTRIWDPASGAVERVPSPQPLYDLFCCGHAFLADGRLLLAGGTSGYIRGGGHHVAHSHYRGSRRTSIFDSRVANGNPWRAAGELQVDPQNTSAGVNPDGTTGGGGRWYPTLITLADRCVVAFGGHPQDGDQRHSNTSVEVFTPTSDGGGTWVLAGNEPQSVIAAIAAIHIPEVYPRAHLLPNGRVFI